MNDRNQDAESNEEFESVKNFPVYRWIGLLLVLVVLIINIIPTESTIVL